MVDRTLLFSEKNTLSDSKTSENTNVCILTNSKKAVIICLSVFRRCTRSVKRYGRSVARNMRQALIDIVGNEALRQRLCRELTNETLSHAYILEGVRGSGKHTIAIEIAAALACEHRQDDAVPLPCGNCAACKKILSGNSPDVIRIGRGDKATLGVEAIRELRNDCFIAPNDLSVKLYLIEDAHLMTVQAQNAFLLTLEEPPPYVLFLLLCESTAPLLETIRSRAPTLRTEPIPTAQIDEYLRSKCPNARTLQTTDPTAYSEILTAADGSIGRAIALLDPKLHKPILERRANAREFVRLCLQKRNSASVLRFLNGLPQKREELIEQCNECLLCLRDLLLCKQTDHAPLCFFSDRNEACTLSYGFTTPALLSLCDHITETAERLRLNANVRLTMTAMLMNCGLLQ